MANWSKTMSENWGRFPACNSSWGDCIAHYYMEGTLSFSRNTSDANKAWVHGPIYMRCSGTQLGWLTASGDVRLRPQCYDVDGNHGYERWQGKGGQCLASFDYNYTHGDCYYALRSGTGLGRNFIGTHFIWGFTPTSSGLDWQDAGFYDYYLPDKLRITAPQGLSVSFPSSISGATSVSITKWGKATNMTGTPTSYPNAKYWNFAVDLLDKNKNYLGHITKNTRETKSASFYGFGYYTASALQYSSAANNSLLTRKYNTAYYLRAVVNNSFNERVSTDSGIIYSPPKAPTVNITSILYQPAKKNCIMQFSWSKPSDESDYTETVSYRVKSSDGSIIVDWTSLGSTSGGALSGNVTVDNLKSGEVYTVEVRVKSTAGTSTDSDEYVAPVANAAFLGFDWDELRRTVTVRAEAPGAANCRIQAGDAPNNYNLGDKLTSGEIGTIVLKDLPHGDGQALYLQAVPEASNGYQYVNEIAKVTVPVPNPILGVLTPPCDSGAEQRYIVDIIEKKADCTVTPKWQTGDRVVVEEPCPPEWGVIYYNDDGGSAQTYELTSLSDLDPLYRSGGATTVLNFSGLSIKKNQITRVDVGSRVEAIGGGFCVNCTNCEEVNLGENVRELGRYFCRNCTKLVKFGGFPDALTVTSGNFLEGCSKFNQPIAFPTNPNWNGNLHGFLSHCGSFNQPIPTEFPAGVTDLSNFLFWCSKFNQPIPTEFPAGVTGLSSFLSNCGSFNQPIPTEFPAGVTDLSNFLYDCYNFNQPIPTEFPAGVTSLSSFLSSCSKFNQPIPTEFPAGVTDLSNFLFWCSKFNQPIPTEFPAGVKNLSSFLSGCSKFNQPIPTEFPAGVKNLSSFLSGCSKFNQPIPQVIPEGVSSLYSWANNWNDFDKQLPPIPATVKTLSGGCFSNLWSYTKDITIPATVTSVPISSTAYLLGHLFGTTDNTHGYTGTVHWETSAVPSGSYINYPFACEYSSSPAYQQGIKVTGAGADALIAALPNRSSKPYRRLVKV